MVKSKLRYYTYKITFKDLPKYFYYGKHKDSGKPYFGSPRTWKHLWDQFEPEIQILQWYETEKEVRENENKIISATWKDKYSLNEHNGLAFSEETCKKAGRIGGRKTLEEGLGIHNQKYRESEEYKQQMSVYGRIGAYKVSEKDRKGKGEALGQKLLKEKRGIFDQSYRTSKEYKNVCSEGGKTTSSQRWMCLVTGHICNAGPLTCYQRARGIDTSKRIRLS